MEELGRSCDELLRNVLKSRVSPEHLLRLTRLTHELSVATESSLKAQSYQHLLQYRKSANQLNLDFKRQDQLKLAGEKSGVLAMFDSQSSAGVQTEERKEREDGEESREELLEAIGRLKNDYFNLVVEKIEKETLLDRVYQFDYLNDQANQEERSYKRVTKLIELKDQLLQETVAKSKKFEGLKSQLAAIRESRAQTIQENRELMLNTQPKDTEEEDESESYETLHEKILLVKLYNVVIQNLLIFSGEDIKDSKVIKDFFLKIDKEY